MMVVGAGGASRWSRLRDPVAVSWFYIFVRPEGNNRLDLNNLPEEYSTTRDDKQLSDDTSSSAGVEVKPSTPVVHSCEKANGRRLRISQWGLEKLLVDSGLHERAEESEKREEVLDRLRKLSCERLGKRAYSVERYTDKMVEDANVVIFTFGSYRLGIREDAGFLCSNVAIGPDFERLHLHQQHQFTGSSKRQLAESPVD
ncbi:hypothetical protein CASFOL_016646 [Castilleja foliolosa]|uniref:Poly(A) polymerase nucleotidyltransferase domain-containing protein n=1 Tax=Castilleja foliolosa TaxID=1961234 RepID=A0ABD3DC68_9LAMI